MFKSGISIACLISLLELVMCISDENKIRVQSTFVSAGEKCVTEHPLTEEDINSFKERQFPEGRGAACFSACVLNKIGVTDDKGALLPNTLEKAKEVFKDEDEFKTVQEVYETCTKDVDTTEDSCDRAKILFKCFIENSEKFGF